MFSMHGPIMSIRVFKPDVDIGPSPRSLPYVWIRCIQVISYLLATGVGAAFGATIDLKEASAGADKFFNRGSAAATLLLLALLFTALSSVCSSLPLSRGS